MMGFNGSTAAVESFKKSDLEKILNAVAYLILMGQESVGLLQAAVLHYCCCLCYDV